MREILFRGKSKAVGSEWLYGDVLIYEKSAQIWETINGRKHNSVVSLETVGQYTGLTDKNGKKIFEGDIVHLTDYDDNEWKAIVVFGNPYGEYSWGWNLLYIGEKPQVNTDILLWVEMADVEVYCEVIGNIHDNPELLKGE